MLAWFWRTEQRSIKYIREVEKRGTNVGADSEGGGLLKMTVSSFL